jgi:hypothetical protein
MKNTGQILRSRKNGKSRYTAINNDILQSSVLTPEEKSILVHLLSLPEDWVVYKGEIWRKLNMGRERFNRNWVGLVDKGYIISVRLIDTETNLVKGWNHIVYEEPVLSDDRTDQFSDSPELGKSEAEGVNKVINEEINDLTNYINNKVITNTKGNESFSLDEAFEQCWKAYSSAASRQVGSKKDAAAKFKRLKSNEIELLRLHLPKFILNHQRAKKTEFLPNFVTYLNQRRFEDEKMPYPDKVAEFENNLNNWYKE